MKRHIQAAIRRDNTDGLAEPDGDYARGCGRIKHGSPGGVEAVC